MEVAGRPPRERRLRIGRGVGRAGRAAAHARCRFGDGDDRRATARPASSRRSPTRCASSPGVTVSRNGGRGSGHVALPARRRLGLHARPRGRHQGERLRRRLRLLDPRRRRASSGSRWSAARRARSSAPTRIGGVVQVVTRSGGRPRARRPSKAGASTRGARRRRRAGSHGGWTLGRGRASAWRATASPGVAPATGELCQQRRLARRRRVGQRRLAPARRRRTSAGRVESHVERPRLPRPVRLEPDRRLHGGRSRLARRRRPRSSTAARWLQPFSAGGAPVDES